MEPALYDRIGRSYSVTRRTDPRLAAAIWEALGDARTVVNVGGGAGAYEPPDRSLVAVEPSPVMIAQRPPGRRVRFRRPPRHCRFPTTASTLRWPSSAIIDWHDRTQGLRELRRVARKRVVLFNTDPAEAGLFWLTAEYLPAFLELIPTRYRVAGAWESELELVLGSVRLVSAPIPHDCMDGFYGAFWRHPSAYLDVKCEPTAVETVLSETSPTASASSI